ncbi:MAG: alpha/beta hydrolase [Candidatus Hodarchaeales archaeon]
MHVIYFYGFASGPLSSKAQFFKDKFLTWCSEKKHFTFNIIDYLPTKESFSKLRVSKLICEIEEIILRFGNKRLILFGSSFGGLISAWLTLCRPELIDRIILMAPALKFSANTIVKSLQADVNEWKQNKEIEVPHYRYDEDIPLAYDFLEDLIENPIPDLTEVDLDRPTIIFHGKNDEVVPIQWSVDFVRNNPKATLFPLDSDHQLLDQKEFMWKKIKDFLSI